MSHLLKRLKFYCQQTDIQFRNTKRYKRWQLYGLPDMRGFTPQLRTVQQYQDEKELTWWHVHDLLHILFYDFAVLHLGKKLWRDEARFLEVHLASEAFAVLGLDYHYLIHTKDRGLAVEIDEVSWPKGFPPPRSLEFALALTEFYLTGRSALFDMDLMKSKFQRQWLGHEIRYGNKQRYYVQAWSDYLRGKKQRRRLAVIENSQVGHGVWELISLLHYSDDRVWKEYVKQISRMKKPRSYFPEFKPTDLDFRYLCFETFQMDDIKAVLKMASQPSASVLFLVWQILSCLDPKRQSAGFLKQVKILAQNAQTDSVDKNMWQDIIQKVITLLSDGKVDTHQRCTFYLP